MPKRDPAHMALRRQQIVDAAIDCFISESYEKTTMKQIGERAGLSIGALYTHYKNKREVMLAVFDFQEEWRQSLTADNFSDFQALLGEIAEDMTCQTNTRHQFNIHTAREALGDPELRAAAGKSVRSSCQLLMRMMSALQKKGEIRSDYDFRLGAHRIAAISLGALIWNYQDEEMNTEQLKAILDDELARMAPVSTHE